MHTIQLRQWDSAEHLKTDEDITRYQELRMKKAGDAAFIAKALENIARAMAISALGLRLEAEAAQT
jgi:DNA-binding phage protein